MTSQKQIESNRRNALNSTGPRTEQGKRRSRHNAFRHGLTAETVVKGLEDARLYKSFQAAIISDYAPLSAVEHELILRLASLLWRLRRATAIETGLLELQADILSDCKTVGAVASKPALDLYRLLGLIVPTAPVASSPQAGCPTHARDRVGETPAVRKKDPRNVAECYVRLASLPKDLFDRVGFYEARLWRQARQIIAMLEAMRGSPSKEASRSLRHAISLRDDFDERSANCRW